MKTFLRVIAAAVGTIAALLLALFVYFSINPPFQLPETGYLSNTGKQTFTVPAGESVAVFRIAARFDPRIYETPNQTFPAAFLSASVTVPGGHDGMDVRLYPDDGARIDHVVAAADRRAIEWQVACDGPNGTRSCEPRYLAVVTSAGRASESEAILELFAEQDFPPHVETPFLTSINLQIEAVDVPAGTTLAATQAADVIRLSPDEPVARQRLGTDAPDTDVAGAILVVTAERDGDPVPAGLDAPPPVHLAIVNAAGAVVANVGVRPGVTSTTVLPVLDDDHEIVAWWQDRADQAYDVEWQIEAAALGDAAPLLDAGPVDRTPSIRQATDSGEVDLTVDGGENVALGMNEEVRGASGDGLPAEIAVLELRLELMGEETDPPALLTLSAEASYATRISIPLRPGAPVTTALSAVPGCLSTGCVAWRGMLNSGESSTVDQSERAASIQWESTLSVWRVGGDDAGGSP